MRGNFVSVIDLQTEQEIWQVKFDRGIRTMSFENNPDGSTRRIFVQLGGFNGFAIVDFAKRAEVARVKLPDEPGGMDRGEESHGAGVAPDGKTYWINSGPANAVFVYSLPDLKLLGHVSLPEVKVPGRPATGGEPHWVTFTPDSKLIYVSSAALGLVSAIDVKAMKLVAQIPAGEGARRINTLIVP